MTDSEWKFITEEIDKALYKHDLSLDTPLRKEIEANAEIGGGPYTRTVCVRDGATWFPSVDGWIAHKKNDPHYRGYFPPEPRRVPRNDWQKVSENLDRIARGEVSVE